MNAAKMVREAKERRPLDYCANPRCLWRLSSGACPKHPIKKPRPIDDLRARQKQQAEASQARSKSGRVMPAKYYDTIKYLAEQHGGVGALAGLYVDEGEDGADVSYSPEGMLDSVFGWSETFDIWKTLGLNTHDAEISAPQRVAERLGVDLGPDGNWPRIPFEPWAAELGITRGE